MKYKIEIVAQWAQRAIFVTLMAGTTGCGELTAVQEAEFNYAKGASNRTTCSNNKRLVDVRPQSYLTTAEGAEILVRAPANYRADFAHPLIVVYSPGGNTANESEGFYEITRQATERGFIVAFVEDARPSPEQVTVYARVPEIVAQSWCVDRARIYATGHSNGGLYSNAVAFLPEARGHFRAIAPSAAGVRKQDLEEYSCPKPTPALIFHGKYDIAFQGWGRGVAEWWAKCNGCTGQRIWGSREICSEYTGCVDGGATIICEGPWPHMAWPTPNNAILDFFLDHGGRIN